MVIKPNQIVLMNFAELFTANRNYFMQHIYFNIFSILLSSSTVKE